MHCREGSEGTGKQYVMRIITMTETLAELLISEEKSILWDMKHKSYHNRLLVDREWSKIA
jgi:deoxyxylulose-5-phosphate synthase